MRLRWGFRPLILAISVVVVLSGCDAGSEDGAATPSGGTSTAAGGTTAKKKSAKKPAPERDLHPKVVLETSLGKITLQLDAEKAPLTVANFLDYVNEGHYNGTIFHQVVNGYIVLGGGFTEDLSERPTRTAIRNEARNGLRNLKGTIAMARQFDAIDSSTCQFFINLTDNPMLDHQGDDLDSYGYCVFGEVVEGWPVVEKISQVEVHDVESFELTPTERIVIESVRTLR